MNLGEWLCWIVLDDFVALDRSHARISRASVFRVLR